MATVHTNKYIVSTPGVMGSRPRIAGRRIAVADVVSYELLGWHIERIADELELTLAEVHAALSYYHDHREEVEESIRKDEEFFRKMKQEYQSK